jgi:hypothetical protein
MRKLILLIIIASTTSCNPFINKPLRQKNRANKKLERLTTKFPSLKAVDTVTVEIPKVEIDTFINLQIDTLKLDSIVYLIKDTVVRKVVRKYISTEVYPKDTVNQLIDGFNFAFWFNGNRLNYSVEKPLKVIKKEVAVIKPIELTALEKFSNLLGKYVWQILLILAILLGFRLIYKTFI